MADTKDRASDRAFEGHHRQPLPSGQHVVLRENNDAARHLDASGTAPDPARRPRLVQERRSGSGEGCRKGGGRLGPAGGRRRGRRYQPMPRSRSCSRSWRRTLSAAPCWCARGSVRSDYPHSRRSDRRHPPLICSRAGLSSDRRHAPPRCPFHNFATSEAGERL